MNNDARRRLVKIAPFLLWPLIASAISFFLGLDILSSTFVFLAVPSIFLSFALPKLVKKIMLFSAATVIPFAIIVDYIAHLTGQWLVIRTFFPRFLGFVSIEDVIWAIVFVYFVLMFYEYFVESRRNTTIWHSRMIYSVGFMWTLLLIFFFFYWFFPEFLEIPYFYLWVGTLTMFLPSIIEIIRRPNLLPKFLVTGSYFFFLTFVYEITALKLGWWTFPSSQYLGWVSILGVSFPLEEFFFGFIFYSMVALTYYESFDDDER